MPRKPTGPLSPLWSEVGDEAARKAHEKRKRANAEAYQYRDEAPFESRPEGPARDYAKEVPDSAHPRSMKNRVEHWLSHGDPWRLWIGSAVLSLLVIQGADHGLIPGTTAFASEASVVQFRAQYMKDRILDTKRSVCLSASRQERRFYVKQLSALVKDYRDLIGPYPRVVSCKVLGIQEIISDAP